MNEILNERKLYNPDSTETPSTQKLFGGDPSGIINMNRIKYQWAYNLWEQMLNNTWFPKEVNMTEDAKDYKELTPDEKLAYDKALSQLIFMDSLQTVNIGMNIQPYVTSAEIVTCLTRQSFEEALHSVSYAVMVDSISPNTDEIYDMFKVDPVLREKNESIAKIYRELGENPTEKNFIKALFANQILEGIFFYSGFAYIYTLAKSGKMLKSADMIRFIQRDELCVHPDTELLTSTGWKKIEDVLETDLVAQYSMENESITFAKPIRKIWREHNGTMFKLIDNRGRTIQNITEGHDLVIKSKSPRTGNILIKKEKVEEAKFNQWKYMPCSGIGQGEWSDLTSEQQFLIALQADGTIDKKRNGLHSGKQVLKFAFNKERKINRFKEILEQCCYEYAIHNVSRKGYVTFYVKIDNKKPFDKDFDWIDLTKVSAEWANQFAEELVLWDGHLASDRDSYYWSTVNKKAIDKVTAVFALANIKFKVTEKEDSRKKSFKNSFRLSYWFDSNFWQTQSLIKEEYNYSGKVGCVTMPEGTIITRIDNQVSVTGNCHLDLFQNMIHEAYKERPDLFTPDLYDDVYDMFRKAVDLEITWGKYITNSQILGLTDGIIENYIKYLADQRLYVVRSAGFKKLYNIEHPIRWIDSYSKISSQKNNFFESTSLSYSKGSIEIDDF